MLRAVCAGLRGRGLNRPQPGPRRLAWIALLCSVALGFALVAPAGPRASTTACPPVLYEPPQLAVLTVSPEQSIYAIGQTITFSTSLTVPGRVSYAPFYDPAKDECESNPQDWQEDPIVSYHWDWTDGTSTNTSSPTASHAWTREQPMGLMWGIIVSVRTRSGRYWEGTQGDPVPVSGVQSGLHADPGGGLQGGRGSLAGDLAGPHLRVVTVG